MNIGDMVETTCNLIITNTEVVAKTEKLDREAEDIWDRKGPEEFAAGLVCMYLRESDDPEVALVSKDMIGRTLLIRKEYLKVIAEAGELNGDDE